MLFLLACTGSDSDTDKTGETGETDSTHACNTENEDCSPGSCGGEGPEMLPGSDCLGCHTAGGGEAPPWTIGGTIFADRWGSAGKSGATIEITGSDGSVTLTSNAAGNFYTSERINGPFTASVTVDGETRTMASEVSTGACSSCHSCDGAAGGKLY